jgi:hypothetical protein
MCMSLLTALLSMGLVSSHVAWSNVTSRDAAVFRAVLRYQKIYVPPATDGGERHHSPAVVVFDQTFRFCDAQRIVWCMSEDTADRVDTWTGSDASSRDLVRNFRVRNRQMVRIANPEPGIVAVADATALEPLTPNWWSTFRQSYPYTWGWARFSAPGFNGAGDALVFVTFSCGPMCGESWLMRLALIGDEYRVERRTLVSVQ